MKTCALCASDDPEIQGNDAEIEIGVTDLEGVLLDSVVACRECARRGLELLGLQVGP